MVGEYEGFRECHIEPDFLLIYKINDIEIVLYLVRVGTHSDLFKYNMKHLHFEKIDSTNTYLKKEYQNLDNLTFVSASLQTSGHGRFSREWYAQKNESLLFSYLLKDALYVENFSYISMFTAVFIVKYLENKGISNVSIKWPNDVYVNGKKIAGILLEGEIPSYIVVGVGLNLLQTSFENDKLRHPATSLKMEIPTFDLEVNNEYKALLNQINDFWADFSGDWHQFDNFIKNHNYLLNKRVKVENISQCIEGIVEDIDAECNLLINNGKEIVKINTGEIEVL